MNFFDRPANWMWLQRGRGLEATECQVELVAKLWGIGLQHDRGFLATEGPGPSPGGGTRPSFNAAVASRATDGGVQMIDPNCQGTDSHERLNRVGPQFTLHHPRHQTGLDLAYPPELTR